MRDGGADTGTNSDGRDASPSHVIPSLSIRSSRARARCWEIPADFRRFTIFNSLPRSGNSSEGASVTARINSAHAFGCSNTSARSSRLTISQLILIPSRSGSCLKVVTASGNSDPAHNNQNGTCWISPRVQGFGLPSDRCFTYSKSHLLHTALASSCFMSRSMSQIVAAKLSSNFSGKGLMHLLRTPPKRKIKHGSAPGDCAKSKR